MPLKAPHTHQKVHYISIPVKLHKLRHGQADLKVPPQFATPAGKLLMDVDIQDSIKASNLHNKQVNEQANAKWAGKSVLPRLLADPGKIWAINNMMDRPNTISPVRDPYAERRERVPPGPMNRLRSKM